MSNKINIEELKPLIVQRLKPLNPEKIILFGSYANGNATKDSDIDLFIIKNDLKNEDIRTNRLNSHKLLWDIVKQIKIGFDIFIDSQENIDKRLQEYQDQFYNEILTKGKVIYAK